MKQFSSSIFSLLFVLSFYASVGWGAENIESCTKKPNIDACNSCCDVAYPPYDSLISGSNPPAYTKTPNQSLGKCQSSCDKKFDDKDKRTSCQAAIKAVRDHKDECGKLDRYRDCAGGMLSDEEDSEGNPLTNILGSVMSKFGTSGKPDEPNACTGLGLSKDLAQARTKEINDLKKQIQDEKDNQIKINKEQKEESKKIDEDERDLNKKLRDLKNKLPNDKKEILNTYQSKIDSIQKQIESLNKNLFESKKDLSNTLHSCKIELLAFANDKVKAQCTSAVKMALKCAKNPAAEECKGLQIPKQGSSIGAKNYIIKTVSTACFENSRTEEGNKKRNCDQRTAGLNRQIELDTKMLGTLTFASNPPCNACPKGSTTEQGMPEPLLSMSGDSLPDTQERYTCEIKRSNCEHAEEVNELNKEIAQLATRRTDLLKEIGEKLANSRAIEQDLQDRLRALIAGKTVDAATDGSSGTLIAAQMTEAAAKVQTCEELISEKNDTCGTPVKRSDSRDRPGTGRKKSGTSSER